MTASLPLNTWLKRSQGYKICELLRQCMAAVTSVRFGTTCVFGRNTTLRFRPSGGYLSKCEPGAAALWRMQVTSIKAKAEQICPRGTMWMSKVSFLSSLSDRLARQGYLAAPFSNKVNGKMTVLRFYLLPERCNAGQENTR